MSDRGALGVTAALLLAGAALAQDDSYGFMPPGGRDLIGRIVGDDAARLAEVAGQDQDRAGWASWAREAAPGMDDTQVETFAAYAALNLPVEEDLLAQIADSGDPALLPPDGKELAVQQCQFCHSLFSGYLMHDRDETGWKGTFKAPFHTEIPMSETERDTFAAYSALNMPMKMQDVPPELRF